MPKSLFFHRLLSAIALAALSLAPIAFAQQSSPASPSQQSDDSQRPGETVKVNVNVVQLFFNVKDKHGALIPSLTKDDFEIAEDNKPQTIKYFTAESNLP